MDRDPPLKGATVSGIPFSLHLSLHMSQVAHEVEAYPGFCSMKRLGVSLLPPWMGYLSIAGLPPALRSSVPIYTPGWREALRVVLCPRTQHNVPGKG